MLPTDCIFVISTFLKSSNTYLQLMLVSKDVHKRLRNFQENNLIHRVRYYLSDYNPKFTKPNPKRNDVINRIRLDEYFKYKDTTFVYDLSMFNAKILYVNSINISRKFKINTQKVILDINPNDIEIKKITTKKEAEDSQIWDRLEKHYDKKNNLEPEKPCLLLNTGDNKHIFTINFDKLQQIIVRPIKYNTMYEHIRSTEHKLWIKNEINHSPKRNIFTNLLLSKNRHSAKIRMKLFDISDKVDRKMKIVKMKKNVKRKIKPPDIDGNISPGDELQNLVDDILSRKDRKVEKDIIPVPTKLWNIKDKMIDSLTVIDKVRDTKNQIKIIPVTEKSTNPNRIRMTEQRKDISKTPSEKYLKRHPFTGYIRYKYNMLNTQHGLDTINLMEHQNKYGYYTYDKKNNFIFEFDRVWSKDLRNYNYTQAYQTIKPVLTSKIQVSYVVDKVYSLVCKAFGSPFVYENIRSALSSYESYIIGSIIPRMLMNGLDDPLYENSDIDIAIKNNEVLSKNQDNISRIIAKVIENILTSGVVSSFSIAKVNNGRTKIIYEIDKKKYHLELFRYIGDIHELIRKFHVPCVRAYIPLGKSGCSIYCYLSFVKALQTQICDISQYRFYSNTDIKKILVKYFNRGFGFNMTIPEIKIFSRFLDENKIKYTISKIEDKKISDQTQNFNTNYVDVEALYKMLK